MPDAASPDSPCEELDSAHRRLCSGSLGRSGRKGRAMSELVATGPPSPEASNICLCLMGHRGHHLPGDVLSLRRAALTGGAMVVKLTERIAPRRVYECPVPPRIEANAHRPCQASTLEGAPDPAQLRVRDDWTSAQVLNAAALVGSACSRGRRTDHG